MGLPSIPKPIISTPILNSAQLEFQPSKSGDDPRHALANGSTWSLKLENRPIFSLKQKTKYLCILPYRQTPAFTTFIHTVRVNSDKEVWLPHLITEIRYQPSCSLIGQTWLIYPILSYPIQENRFQAFALTLYVEEQPRHMIFFGYPSSCG